jgi:NAD(P)-dependent dehydrogenase (short-subunit alcohol dehydrogenase family)
MELEGTSAIVTGGASGIGEASARRLSLLGARPIICDLNEEKGKAVAAELKGEFVRCDVTKTEDNQAAVDAAIALAPLRAVVNAAGIGNANRTVNRKGDPFPLDQYTFVIKVNLIGTFDMTRLAAAAMSKQDPVDNEGQRGAIVNIASVAAFDGQIGQAAYSSSKGGVVGMTLPVARDLSALGIRLNTIAPGLIDTPIYGSGEGSDAFKAKLGQNVLFPKRLGVASELASMVAECITNDYMNAEVIRVDGGIRMPPK